MGCHCLLRLSELRICKKPRRHIAHRMYPKNNGYYLIPKVLCSLVQLCPTLTPWTIAHQAPPSTGFSRQEYWSGLPFPSSGDLPNPGIKPRSPTLQGDTLPSEPLGKPPQFLRHMIKENLPRFNLGKSPLDE